MDNPLLCFVHIPKTAGTSVRASLRQMVGAERVYWIGETQSYQGWLDATGREFENFAVVGGHAPASAFLKIDRPKVFATAVRDPVKRAASFFRYIIEGPDENHPLRAQLRSIGLERALRTLRDFRSQVQNLQCGWIGGVPRFEHAASALSRDDWIVSRHDRIHGLLSEVARRFNWPLPRIEILNAAAEPYYERLCTPKIERQLRNLNREDCRLVDLVSQRSATQIDLVNADAKPDTSPPSR